MNKKNIFLVINLFAMNIAIFSMSDSEKLAIRKELYSNYENDRINSATLVEDGLTLTEVIDRDIQILSEHKNVLLKKMDVYKGRMIWDPAFDKVGVVFSGTIAAVACAIHALASETIREFTNNGQLLVNTGNWSTDYVEYFKMSTREYKNLIRKNLATKASQDPEAMLACLCVLPAYIITFVAGGMCLKKIYDVFRSPRKWNACIQEAQKRFERDQAIVVQLKEIKHTLVI
jgi:hypothetical protein